MAANFCTENKRTGDSSLKILKFTEKLKKLAGYCKKKIIIKLKRFFLQNTLLKKIDDNVQVSCISIKAYRKKT